MSINVSEGIRGDLVQLDNDAIVTLFELDLTDLDGPIYMFHNEEVEETDIHFDGNIYTPVPIQANGFEYTGNGKSPRPTLTISNVTGAVTALNLQYQDLVGSKFTRRRTFAKHLTQPLGLDPDNSQEFQREVYYIERKKNETKVSCEYELTSILDVEGVKVPKRQVLQNLCNWKYRSGVGCGYAGDPIEDKNGNPINGPFVDRGVWTTTPSPAYAIGDVVSFGNARFKYVCKTAGTVENPFNSDDWTADVCTKKVGGAQTGCKGRFGINEELPFGGFTGVVK